MIYNGLTSLDGSLTPQPALAESFTTQDAKTWVFTLRKGVVFHDGKALSPADVVFSILRHKDPATASKAKVLADQIETVRASGPNEVTMVLSAPNADLPVILVDTGYLFPETYDFADELTHRLQLNLKTLAMSRLTLTSSSTMLMESTT